MQMTPSLITIYEDAVEFLDARIGHGIRPGLDRMRALLELMTDPQDTYPSVHVAGTNGKTTVVWIVEALLEAHGLRTGSYTSPHLERIEDRFRVSGITFDESRLTAAIADVAPFIEIYEERHGDSVTYFESTVAAAFQAFAAAGVNVAVVEVGLGGRLDATNTIDGDVSVITGIALDHTAILGESLGEIAAEKAGILGAGGRLVTGPLLPGAEGAVTARVAETSASWHRFGSDFGIRSVAKAVGGWSASIDGLYDDYEDLVLPLHGRHQIDHLATAVAATEAFFGHGLDLDSVVAALTSVTAPGRIEIAGRRPLVLIDGAHNVEGMEGLAAALRDEFPDTHRILVVGLRGPRDPAELLRPLRGLVDEVIATEARDAAVAAEGVAASARTELGVPAHVTVPVADAVAEAVERSEDDGAVVVAGSLYVAGEARSSLGAG